MFDYVFFPSNAFFSHQGGVGSHAIQNAEIIGFPDLVQICGVNKKFHIINLNRIQKKWQVTYIAPLNHLPLLPSGPGGFSRSWPYKTCHHKGKRFKAQSLKLKA